LSSSNALAASSIAVHGQFVSYTFGELDSSPPAVLELCI